MKIYIVTDLEGATGVFKFRQTREKDSPEFREAMRLLMGDVAAVATGLREAGAREIYVLDGHDGGDNFIPECMVSGVRYITGWPRSGVLHGLDGSFAGCVLLGYHAMNGTSDGVLHHTQSSLSEAKYWYDGVERGEIYQCAVMAGHFDVPVILVTGDEAACREARATLGDDLPTVAVKRGISREAAILLSPDDTRPLLIEGARRAVEAIPRLRPYKVSLPMKLRIRRRSPEGGSPDSPYFVEQELVVRSALDVITGSRD